MLELTDVVEVPDAVVDAAAGGLLAAVLAAGDGEGAGAWRCRLAVEPASVRTPATRALYLALAEDRSDLGAALVGALWFSGPLTVSVTTAAGAVVAMHVAAWRCHIAGEPFARVLAHVRRDDAAADVASVWELLVLDAHEVPALPEAAGPTRAPRAELHLDALARRGVGVV